jgi:inner membrane protein
MPSPLGHALAAVTMHAWAARGGAPLLDARRIGVVVAAAVAPDLDLLLKYVDGRNHHQMESHSLGCAVLAGLVVWALARWRAWEGAALLGLLGAAGWGSHVLLDYLGKDTHPPIGVMALWPLSPGFFKFPWPIFLDLGRTLDWETIRHNARSVAWEAALLLPPALLSWRIASTRAR